MLFADRALARRLETAEAANARGCAPSGAEILEVGGGCAIFCGAASPLTQAVGIGLNGPVAIAEIEAAEKFFRSRGAGVSIDLCPLADHGLIEALGARGYRIAEFNNVLVKRLPADGLPPVARVRRAAPAEADLWSETVGRGFFEAAQLTPAEMDVGRAIFAMPGAMCYLAETEGGEAAAGAAMAVDAGVAGLFADTTLRAFRRCGFHRDIIAARLADASALGCDVAFAAALPGSASQRNYERLGFRIAYTKVTLAA